MKQATDLNRSKSHLISSPVPRADKLDVRPPKFKGQSLQGDLCFTYSLDPEPSSVAIK